MLLVFSVSLLTIAFNIEAVRASGFVYIRADGSIEGTTNIMTVDNVIYNLTDNLYGSIIIERNNIVVDGAGYTVNGKGSETGIYLSGRNNVTLKNVEVTN